ncbi:MAG: hypothetical protein ABSF43_00795 [Rectinemataceae bacterium]|jgi:hypothetical protein
MAALTSIALAFFLSLATEGAEGPVAQGMEATAPDAAAVLLFPAVILGGNGPGGTEAATFSSALADALDRAFTELSFRVSRSSEALDQSEGLPAEASSRALAAGTRWAAVASVEVADKRIAYSFRIYDATEIALVASAGFSAYAGLTALPLMADSANAVASKTAAYRSSVSRGVGVPIQYRITVTSPDEGASVSIGAAGAWGSRPLGTIVGGALLLPYIPFEKGTKIVISLSEKGKAPIDIPIELGEEETHVAAPALRKLDKENLLLGTGPGRLLGLGITYRYYTRPEWDFLFVNERIFAGYDFGPNSIPLLHCETWEGLGWYLLFPPKSPFRLGAGVGWGFLASFSSSASPTSDNSVFWDVAIIPIEAFFEYRLKSGPTLWLSVRGAYSINSSGLLGRGWMGNGQPDLSAGLLWRR